MRRAWLWLPALLSVGACFPSRDNVHDPNRRPDAALSLIDRANGDACGAGFSTAVWPVVSASTQRRCLALTADGSDDPQHTTLRYRFGVSMTDGVLSLIDEDGQLAQDSVGFGALPAVALSSSLVFALPFEKAIEFQVEVKDGEGATRTARVPFVKTNRRPIAVADGARLLPRGSYPWSAGTSIPIVFHGGASFDLDGDPLQFCWRIDDGSEDCSTAEDTPPVPVDAGSTQRIVGRLRVWDGDQYSAPYWAWVRVGDLSIWLAGGDALINYDDADFGEYERVATFPPTGFDLPGVSVAQSIQTEGGEVGLGLAGGGVLYPMPFPEAAPIGTPLTLGGSAPQGIAVVPGSEEAWVVTDVAQTNWHVQRLSISRSGTAITLSPLGSEYQIAHDELYGDFFSADASGNLFVATFVEGHGRVWTVTTAGVAEIVSDPSWSTLGLAGRPPAPDAPSEMWRVRRPVTETNGELPDRAEIEVWAPGASGPGVVRAIQLPSENASGFEWIDDGEFWIQVTGYGLLRMDARILFSRGFDEAVILRIPEVGSVTNTVVDKRAGIYWANVDDPEIYNHQAVLRASPSGAVEIQRTPQYYPAQVRFVDVDGMPWFKDLADFDFGRAESASDARVISSVSVPFPIGTYSGLAVSDVVTGGLWVPLRTGEFSLSLVHLSVEGVLDREISRYVEGGVERHIASQLARFHLDPDGTGIWLVEYAPQSIDAELVHLDLSTDPPVGTRLLSGGIVTPITLSHLFSPSAPSATMDPFFWVWDGADAIVAHPLDASGDTVFSYPGELDGGVMWGTLEPKTNGLCLATRRFVGPGSEGEIVLRYLAPDGGETELGTWPLLDYFSNLLAAPVGAYADDSGTYCWFAPSETEYPGRFEIHAYKTDGTVVHRLPEISDVGVVTSISPVSPDAAWLTLRIDTGANGATLYAVRAYVDFPPVVGASNGTLTQLPPTIDGLVVGPFSSY